MFTPFAIRSLEEIRVENLSQIVARTAKIGNILFGQPSTWRFRWNLTSVHRMQGTVPEEENTKVMIKPSVVVYPAIEKIGDVNGAELVEPILKEEAEVFFLPTFSKLSSNSEVSRKGSLDNNDLALPKSIDPRPVAHGRTPPDHSSFPERQQSKRVLEAAPTSRRLPFEGQQSPLGPKVPHPGTTETQSRIHVSELDVARPRTQQEEKIKGSKGVKGLIQSLRTVGTIFGVLLGTGTEKGAMGAASFPTQNPSTPNTDKSLPVLPDSSERQERPITSEGIDNEPGIDSDLNGSEDILHLANRIMEHDKRVSV